MQTADIMLDTQRCLTNVCFFLTMDCSSSSLFLGKWLLHSSQVSSGCWRVVVRDTASDSMQRFEKRHRGLVYAEVCSENVLPTLTMNVLT